jgi:hypothetical protein
MSFVSRIISTVGLGSEWGGVCETAISQSVSPGKTVYRMGCIPASAPVPAYRAKAPAAATNRAPRRLLRYVERVDFTPETYGHPTHFPRVFWAPEGVFGG